MTDDRGLAALAERFWDRVDASGDCWLWTGTTNGKGYGVVSLDGHHTPAHRAAWLLTGNTIPTGLQLDHLCRTRACVNPDHLEPVTIRENVLRGVGPSAMAARTDICRYGHPKDGRKRHNGRSIRYCTTCQSARARDLRARRAALRPPKPNTCHAGHPRTPENTYARTDGFRECRVCKSGYKRAAKERARAAA